MSHEMSEEETNNSRLRSRLPEDVHNELDFEDTVSDDETDSLVDDAENKETANAEEQEGGKDNHITENEEIDGERSELGKIDEIEILKVDTNEEKKSVDEEREEGEVSDEEEREEGETTDSEMLDIGVEEENKPTKIQSKTSSIDKQTTQTKCKFFLRGFCQFGLNCRFVHSGNDNNMGNYTMFNPVEQIPNTFMTQPMLHQMNPYAFMPFPATFSAFPEYNQVPVANEGLSAWENGLRNARQTLVVASKRKIEEPDYEEKRLNCKIGAKDRDNRMSEKSELSDEENDVHNYHYYRTSDRQHSFNKNGRQKKNSYNEEFENYKQLREQEEHMDWKKKMYGDFKTSGKTDEWNDPWKRSSRKSNPIRTSTSSSESVSSSNMHSRSRSSSSEHSYKPRRLSNQRELTKPKRNRENYSSNTKRRSSTSYSPDNQSPRYNELPNKSNQALRRHGATRYKFTSVTERSRLSISYSRSRSRSISRTRLRSSSISRPRKRQRVRSRSNSKAKGPRSRSISRTKQSLRTNSRSKSISRQRPTTTMRSIINTLNSNARKNAQTNQIKSSSSKCVSKHNNPISSAEKKRETEKKNEAAKPLVRFKLKNSKQQKDSVSTTSNKLLKPSPLADLYNDENVDNNSSDTKDNTQKDATKHSGSERIKKSHKRQRTSSDQDTGTKNKDKSHESPCTSHINNTKKKRKSDSPENHLSRKDKLLREIQALEEDIAKKKAARH